MANMAEKIGALDVSYYVDISMNFTVSGTKYLVIDGCGSGY